MVSSRYVKANNRKEALIHLALTPFTALWESDIQFPSLVSILGFESFCGTVLIQLALTSCILAFPVFFSLVGSERGSIWSHTHGLFLRVSMAHPFVIFVLMQPFSLANVPSFLRLIYRFKVPFFFSAKPIYFIHSVELYQ